MMHSLLITGGTGVLGSATVGLAEQRKLDYLAVSRQRTERSAYRSTAVAEPRAFNWKEVDLITGRGLLPALPAEGVVLHLAGAVGTKNGEPLEITFARNLLRAARQAHIGHLVYISIVGIDRIPLAYYRAKRAVEEMIISSGIPYTIVRTTQFHEFIEFQLSMLAKLPLAFFPPGLLFQPIQVEAVASHLLDICELPPANGLVQIGGPQVHTLANLFDDWKMVAGVQKRAVALPAFGGFMRALKSGYATCPEKSDRSIGWLDYLVNKYKTK
jgi:uncharacterized protein YbjT (DUF2867 family)